MDTPGYFTVQPFEVGGWLEVTSFRCLAVRLLVRLARLFACLLRVLPRGGGRMEASPQFGDSGFPFVEFRVEGAHLSEIAAFKRREVAAKIDKFQLTLG